MIQELTTDYKSFEEFRDADKSGHMLWYHGTHETAIENMVNGNGFQTSNEHYNGQCYGRGLYGYLRREWSHYGNACLCCLIKKKAPNYFIFFSKRLKDAYAHFVEPQYQKENFRETLLRLAPDLINERSLNYWNQRWEMGQDIGDEFLEMVGDTNSKCVNRSDRCDNRLKALDESDILGYVFNYGGVPSLVVRSFDIIAPYRYWLNSKGQLNGSQLVGEGTECFTEKNKDSFEKNNLCIDFYNRFCREYPLTPYPGLLRCGFGLLIKNGGGVKKYNYASAFTEKKVSPYDFDFAVPFDPALNKAKCGWDLGECTFKFTLYSSNYGKNLKITMQKIDKGKKPKDDSEEIEIAYQQLICLANGIKSGRGQLAEKRKFFKKCLNEALFFNGTHEEFQKKMKDEEDNERNDNFNHDYVFVYSATSEKNIPSIMRNGQSREFLGTSGDKGIAYGLTISTCLNLKAALGNTGYTYGNAIVKYALKGGFKNFLIFKNDVRKKYDPEHPTVYDELVSIIPKDVLPEFKEALYKANCGRNPNFCRLEDYKKDCDSNGHPARCIMNAVFGSPVGKINDATYYDEQLYSKTRIRGIVFRSGLNGDAVMIRDYGSIIPVAYTLDEGRTWHKNEYLDDPKVFDRYNKNVDAYHAYRAEYNKIHHFNNRQRCGYVMVEGANGANYMNVASDRHLLPVNVPSATHFDPIKRCATFSMANLKFILSLRGKEDCDIPTLYLKGEVNGQVVEKECPYGTFVKVIQALMANGTLPKGEIFNDNILQEGN